MDYQALVDDIVGDVHAYRGSGKVASYIPALAEADAHSFGLAIALADGSTYVAGEGDETFTIQSISYVFSLALALHHVKSALWNHVGREPAGSPVNSIIQLEIEKGKPRNPLTSSGALVVCDQLIGRRGREEACSELLQFLRERAGAGEIGIDETIAMSESRAGAFNRSLAHFIAAFGNLKNPPEEVLSLYYRQCSVAMSCRQLAQAALFLAFDGHDPVKGDVVCTPSRARRINALMLTSGHYDNSGDFAFRVGLPGKSAVSGAILAIVPRTGVVCVWSPGLNDAGTSLVGAVALERLVERTGWSIFV
ncbi:glutaminase [Allosphingosinicella deserti]|uniref:Glutaminase n=1 Tax=Allosphingosinicella deserti TaxID=2116704 RepID=A0A2P7QZ25_9SPHN|nr:glutaminase [Sphingomonas deserti]PSJ43222.1 glutaminase [Sphingomonas deserti]